VKTFRAALIFLALFTLLTLSSCAQPITGATREVLAADAYIAAEYDTVWSHFTDADAYAAWYSAPCRSFGARAGQACEWADDERVYYRGTVESIEKGRGLRHTFQFAMFDFGEPPTPVDIEIIPSGETVLVRIRHDVTGAPQTRDVITDVGWQKSLSRLKTLLETGSPMPWPQ